MKNNPLFDAAIKKADPKVMEEVNENIDFELALYDHFGQVKDFTLGMRIGQYFYELGKQWQYQKDRGEFAKIKAKTWCEGFDACKEQMMKEAVEGEVENATLGIVYLRKNLVNEGYSTGDKVRIIIVKEDEE